MLSKIMRIGAEIVSLLFVMDGWQVPYGLYLIQHEVMAVFRLK